MAAAEAVPRTDCSATPEGRLRLCPWGAGIATRALKDGLSSAPWAPAVEDDSLLDEEADIPETGHLNEQGEMVRPWCPATRILEHREMVSGLALPGVSVQ